MGLKCTRFFRWNTAMLQIGIVMGSTSDWDVMQHADPAAERPEHSL